ncbi:hypothetical protein ACSS6W_008787 [Trichoderma asperelloides]
MLGLLEAAALGEAPQATTGLTPPVPASGAARRGGLRACTGADNLGSVPTASARPGTSPALLMPGAAERGLRKARTWRPALSAARESGSGPCAAKLAIVSLDGPPRAALVLDTVRVWALIREFRVVTAFASLDEALFEQKPGRPSHLRWPVDTSKLALSRSGLHLAESQRKHSGRTMASVGSRWRCDGTCGGLHQWLRWAPVDR